MTKYKSKFTGQQIDDGIEYGVRVTQQTLSSAQKQQARENIGAQEVVTDMAKLGGGIGTCSTSSGTALTVTLSGYELVQNGIVAVSFSNDVPAGATLNINSKGAKPIFYKGSAIIADTIKADDTVMFCYDGTNYVVTSLGGGGGSVVFLEFVTIQLTQSGGSDSDLIGATVVVTDDNTSDTILSTTWQGTNIALQVDDSVDYTVTVGNITDYEIRPNSQSYTAEGGLMRMITFKYSGETVDLGLPSGILWARGNLVYNSGYKIGDETDRGAYTSYGNVTPHFSSNGSSFDDGYSFSETNYNSSIGAAITSSSYPNTDAVFAPNSGYDIARKLLGNGWRLPTADDFQELVDNCTSIWTTKAGVNGREFTSNINGKKIFIPALGISLTYTGTDGYYVSSSLATSTNLYVLEFSSSGINPKRSIQRYRGYTVRPVM